MGVVAGDPVPEPQRVRDTERLAKYVFDLVARQARIARLHDWIEQTLLGRQQRPAPVDVDAATLEHDPAIGQRELELFRSPLGKSRVQPRFVGKRRKSTRARSTPTFFRTRVACVSCAAELTRMRTTSPGASV